jgi:flavin-dependent thymidylate synthase
MYSAEPVEGLSVTLLAATPDPLGSIAAASNIYKGKVIRSKTDLTDIERVDFFEDIQKTHLQAPLEYMDLHFLLEGVTRSFTHQLVRQRTAVYAQESMRFAVKEDLVTEAVKPPSLVDKGESGVFKSSKEQEIAVSIWDDAIAHIDEAYKVLVNMGVPAEDARGLMPHATPTRVHYKTNLRGLADHAGNRLCTQAQFEWREVIALMIKAIYNYSTPMADFMKDDGWQFMRIAESKLFQPVCFTQGKCPFNASFDRGCTIRPRVEEGKFDEISMGEWMLDPAAARRDK